MYVHECDNIQNVLKDLNILFIEDDIVLFGIYFESLQLLFKNVYTAHDGIDGLEVFKNNPDINIVLTDINMPEMNGINMVKEMKKIREDFFCIATTGWEKEELLKVDKHYNDFFDLIIEKPYELPSILSAICSLEIAKY